MNCRIIDLKNYKDKSINEESEFQNIVNFLQIKLIEEIFYKADIEINRLYDRIDKLPGMKHIMKMGGRKNLDFYFHKLFLDKLLDQVIIIDEEENQNEIINNMRIEMLNNLIIKYIPKSKRKELINNEEIRNMFFRSIPENYLYGCNKEDLEEYFEYKNEKIELFHDENGEPIDKYHRENKTKSECNEIESSVLGTIKFYEEKNIYFCDYIGKFNNFTLKILSNDKEKVEKMLPLIEKMIENIDLVNKYINNQIRDSMDDLSKNDMKEAVNNEEEIFLENMSEFTSDISNLISINIWPDKRIYLIYSYINEHEGKKSSRIGIAGGKDIYGEVFGI
ncbi:MAG: hypothetical protein ACI398_02360 [Clostridium sp.]